ncbi:MAG: putative zinc-binding metallopeptidase [Paludibacteraceae bacterium]
MKKTIFRITTALFIGFIFIGCQKEEFNPSIFDITETKLDPSSYTYGFDKFLQEEYSKPYNLTFDYQMKDVASDMEYNLMPASLENSKKLAVLVKYLWFDVYAKVVDPTFLKKYGPRMIHLIGSSAYNPISGTIVLGTAEGGIKITLYRVNSINTNDPDMMNEYYFKTMHHEFAHILHQTKSYPAEFNLISYKYYDPFAWQDRQSKLDMNEPKSQAVAYSLGFVSAYGSSQTREDFVEIIANYIVKTDAQWNTMLDMASRGWEIDGSGNSTYTSETYRLDTISTNPLKVVKIIIDTDGVDGRATILNKLNICRTWFRDKWNIDLDALRAEVQYRQARIDMVSLLSQIK